MLRYGNFSPGHSDRKPRMSNIFIKGSKSKTKKYDREVIRNGKIYTEDSLFVKLVKLIEVLALFIVIGYLSYMLLTSFVEGA